MLTLLHKYTIIFRLAKIFIGNGSISDKKRFLYYVKRISSYPQKE